MAKSEKLERRALAEQMLNQKRQQERRRSFLIVGVGVAAATLIIGLAAFQPIKSWWDTREFAKLDLAAIGAPASVCSKITTKDASGSGQHSPEGTPMNYTDAPPAFGPHWAIWESFDKRGFYVTEDRPDLGKLVHNLEHGYTIVWYDDTIDPDSTEGNQLRAVSQKMLDLGDNFRSKFLAVPWTEADGKPFPEGQHIAFTHWSAGTGNADLGGYDDGKQRGVWQYCSAFSGAALKDFMDSFPYTDSPEPGVM